MKVSDGSKIILIPSNALMSVADDTTLMSGVSNRISSVG